VSDHAAPDAELARIIGKLGELLGSPNGTPVALTGGITNRNYRLNMGGVDYVLRVSGKDTGVLGIDRAAEVAATRAANMAGIAPPIAAFLPEEGCIVTRFVEGRPVTADELRDPYTLAQVATSIRMVHQGPRFTTAFSAHAIVRDYDRQTRERGGAVPAEYGEALAIADRIAAVLTGPEHAPVPCHNDLLTANFIDDGSRVRIVDWEYAGMGDRYFDLGNLSVNNGFDEADDERLLAAYFGTPCTPERFAALRLMRVMSDFREAMWGTIQAVVSDLDFDYSAYAATHFERLLAAASGPRFEEWLSHGQAP
jgi:thiamine kinase-like enzyme